MSKLRSPTTNIYITNIANTSPSPENLNELQLLLAISKSTYSSPKKDNKHIKLMNNQRTPFENRNETESPLISNNTSVVSTPKSFNHKLNTTMDGLTAEIQDLHEQHTQLMNTSQNLINTPTPNTHSYLNPSSKLKKNSQPIFSPPSSSNSSRSSFYTSSLSPSKSTRVNKTNYKDEIKEEKQDKRESYVKEDNQDSIIHELQSKIKNLEKQNQDLTSSINDMKLENVKLADEIHQYTNDNSIDTNQNDTLETDEKKVKELETTTNNEYQRLVDENSELKDKYHQLSGKYNSLFIDYNRVVHDLNMKHVLTVESINNIIFNSTKKDKYSPISFDYIFMKCDNSFDELNNELKKERELHRNDVEKYEKMIEEDKQKIDKKDEKLINMKEKYEKILSENNEMKEKNKNYKIQLNKAKQIIAMNKENIIHLNNQINTVEYEKNEIQKKLDKLKQEYEKVNEENDSFKNEFISLNDEIKELKKCNNDSEEKLKVVCEENEKLRKENNESNEMLQNLRSEYEEVNNQSKDLLQQNRQFQHQNSVLLQQNHEFKEQNDELLFQNQQYEKSNNELVKKMNSFEKSMLNMNNKQLEFQTTCMKLKEEINGYCDYIEELKNQPLCLCEFNIEECILPNPKINFTQELIDSMVNIDLKTQSFRINEYKYDEFPLVNISSPIVSFNRKERLSVKNYLIENYIKADISLEEVKSPLESIVYNQEVDSILNFDMTNSIEEIPSLIIKESNSITITNEDYDSLSIFNEEVDIYYYSVVEYSQIEYSATNIIQKPIQLKISSSYDSIIGIDENKVFDMKKYTTSGTESILIEDELSVIDNNRTNFILNDSDNLNESMKYQSCEIVDLLYSDNDIQQDEKEINKSEKMEVFSVQLYPLISECYNSEKEERISPINTPESFRNLSISSLSFSPTRYHNYEFCIILYHPIDFIYSSINSKMGLENDNEELVVVNSDGIAIQCNDDIELKTINCETVSLLFEPEGVKVEKTVKSNLQTSMTLIKDSIEMQSKSSIFSDDYGKEMEELEFIKTDYTRLDLIIEAKEANDVEIQQLEKEKLTLIQYSVDMNYDIENVLKEEREDFDLYLIQEYVDMRCEEEIAKEKRGSEEYSEEESKVNEVEENVNDEEVIEYIDIRSQKEIQCIIVEERINLIYEEDDQNDLKVLEYSGENEEMEVLKDVEEDKQESNEEDEVGEESEIENQSNNESTNDGVKDNQIKDRLSLIEHSLNLEYEEMDIIKMNHFDLQLNQELINLTNDDNDSGERSREYDYIENDYQLEYVTFDITCKEVIENEKKNDENDYNKYDGIEIQQMKEELSILKSSRDLENSREEEEYEVDNEELGEDEVEQMNEELLVEEHSVDLNYENMNEIEMKDYHLQLIQELTEIINEEKKDMKEDEENDNLYDEEEMYNREEEINEPRVEDKESEENNFHLIQELIDIKCEEGDKKENEMNEYDKELSLFQYSLDLKYDEVNDNVKMREYNLYLMEETTNLISEEEVVVDREYNYQLVEDSIDLKYEENNHLIQEYTQLIGEDINKEEEDVKQELSLVNYSVDLEYEDVKENDLQLTSLTTMIEENKDDLSILHYSLGFTYKEKEDEEKKDEDKGYIFQIIEECVDIRYEEKEEMKEYEENEITRRLGLDQHHIDIVITTIRDDTHSLENSSLNYIPENEINESSHEFRNLDLSTIEYNEVSSIIPPSRILRMVNKQLDPSLSYEISELNDLVYELDDIIEEHCNMIKNLSEDKNALLKRLNKLEKRYDIYKQYLKELAQRLGDNTVVVYDNVNIVINDRERRNSGGLQFICYELMELKVIPIHQSIRKEDIPLLFEILDLTSQVNNLESKIDNHLNVISEYELMNESLAMKNQELSQRLLEFEHSK